MQQGENGIHVVSSCWIVALLLCSSLLEIGVTTCQDNTWQVGLGTSGQGPWCVWRERRPCRHGNTLIVSLSFSLSLYPQSQSFIHSFFALDNHFTLLVPNMVVLRLLLDHNILSTTFLSSSSFTTITFQQGLYQFLCLSSYIASDQRTV